jgi:hypothetical protein
MEEAAARINIAVNPETQAGMIYFINFLLAKFIIDGRR